MKVAAIDIGTNSTRFLLSQIEKSAGGRPTAVPVFREMKITRLGKNLGQTKVINEESSALTIAVLKEYQRCLKNNSVTKYRAVGTRVLRLAANADKFIKRVFDETGLRVEVLSGKEEAFLSFSGATRELNDANIFKISGEALKGYGKSKNILVIDIGGGSTEFILGSPEDQKVVYLESIDIGSVTLSEEFLNDQIPEQESVRNLLHFIEKRLKKPVEKIIQEGFIYMTGLAGTISSLSAMDLEIAEYDREKIHGHILKKDRVMDIFKVLCLLDLNARKKLKGLESARADIIIGGAAILLKILEMLGIDSLAVSENDILDGIIYSQLY